MAVRVSFPYPYKITPKDIITAKRRCRKRTFSEIEKEEITKRSKNKLKTKSLRKTQKIFSHKFNKTISIVTIRRYRTVKITKKNQADRIKYFNGMFEIDPDAINNMIFCNEFYVYNDRKCNSKNDIIL